MSKKPRLSDAKPHILKPKLRLELDLKNYPNSWYLFCGVLYLCYCYAAIAPTGPVWGIHFIAYIPVALMLPLLVAGGLLLLPGIQRSLYLRLTGLFSNTVDESAVRLLAPAIVAIVSFFLFRAFAMNSDIYGDGINMIKWYGDNAAFDWNWITDVLSPHLLDNKEALTVGLHRMVAHFFSLPIESSYRIVSALCGGLFVFVWILFTQRISNGPLRAVLALLGVSTGAVQVFFGHVENYPFGILTSTLFLVTLYYYLEEEVSTLTLVLLYVLAFKAHIIAVLFLPALLMALAYRYRGTYPFLQSLFSWRRLLTAVVLPALLIGIILYIFLFHSWDEPYAMSTGRQFQQTFLPVVMLPAPLHHYTLWAPYHIADFFNVLLLTVAPIVVILSATFLFNRKAINWSQPRVIVFGFAALFPFLFFMAMNPTLSPVRDWDVYTLLMPPLLFFAALLMLQPGVRSYASGWLGTSVIFGLLFTSVLVAVNASPLELQRRLEDAGAYTYRSYYAGSAYIEARSFALNESSTEVPVHFAHIVEELSQVSTPGRDEELAKMTSRLASFYGFIGDNSSAIRWAIATKNEDSVNETYASDLARYYVQADRLSDASNYFEGLIKSGMLGNVQTLAEIMGQLAARYSRTGDDQATIAWANEASRLDPSNLKYIYDLADYYNQTNRPLQALGELRLIPPDSASVESLTEMALAAEKAYRPDSGLPYLYKAKEMAPGNSTVDSLIRKLKMR